MGIYSDLPEAHWQKLRKHEIESHIDHRLNFHVWLNSCESAECLVLDSKDKHNSLQLVWTLSGELVWTLSGENLAHTWTPLCSRLW